MVVAMDHCSGHLAEQLRQMGYEVVDYGRYAHPVDALVYSGKLPRGSQMGMSVFDTEQAGILLVCADGKSAAEVDAILQRRLYTPLF